MNETEHINATIDALLIEPYVIEKYRYVIFLIDIIVSTLNLIGNSVVLVLICQRRLLGRTTNVSVFSLAMADTVCCLGSIPYHVFQVLNMSMSVYLCKGYFYTLCISRTAVSYTIVLLTTEKIVNILRPSRLITAGRCLFFISLVWFFSAAYNVWSIVFYTIYYTDSPEDIYLDYSVGMYGRRCFFSPRFNFLKPIFIGVDLMVLFLLPLCILLVQFYLTVRRMHGNLKQRFETYFYIMRFLIFVFIIFILCHFPVEIATVVKNSFDESSLTTDMFYDIAILIYYTRGVCNLVIYGYFKQYVCKRRRRLSMTANSSNKIHFDLSVRRHFRGLSDHELRTLRWIKSDILDRQRCICMMKLLLVIILSEPH